MNRITKEVKIALLMAASLFMEILDGTIVTTALGLYKGSQVL